MDLFGEKNWWTIRSGGDRRIAFRVHWTLLVTLVLSSSSTFEAAPVRWAAIVVLVLCHELGHALFVRIAGARVTSVGIHGFGGQCEWRGSVSSLQRAYIALGGVAAQAVLFVAALALSLVGARPFGGFTSEVLGVFLFTNAWIAAVNLIPVAPFDGAEGWAFFRLFALRRRKKRLERALGDLGHTIIVTSAEGPRDRREKDNRFGPN